MGWEAGVNKTFKDAPQFMWIYTSIIVISVIIVLVPGSPLVLLMVLSSFINGLLLPFVLVFALILVNNKKIMGEYVNNRFFNVVTWLTVSTLIVLISALIILSITKLKG